MARHVATPVPSNCLALIQRQRRGKTGPWPLLSLFLLDVSGTSLLLRFARAHKSLLDSTSTSRCANFLFSTVAAWPNIFLGCLANLAASLSNQAQRSQLSSLIVELCISRSEVSAQLFFVNIVFFDPGMHFLYVNQVFYATWP